MLLAATTVLLSWVAASVFAVGIALALIKLNVIMVWYSRPKFALLLFGLPALFGMMLIHFIGNKIMRKVMFLFCLFKLFIPYYYFMCIEQQIPRKLFFLNILERTTSLNKLYLSWYLFQMNATVLQKRNVLLLNNEIIQKIETKKGAWGCGCLAGMLVKKFNLIYDMW